MVGGGGPVGCGGTGGAGTGGGGEFIIGVAVPLLLALLLLLDDEHVDEVVDMLEQEPVEQHEAEELPEDELADDEEFDEMGLSRLRSLLGVWDPSLL